MITTYAFESEIGAAASNARKPYTRYGADVAQRLSRFMAKSPFAGPAAPGRRKGGA